MIVSRKVIFMRTLGHFTNAFIAPPAPTADEPRPKDVVPFGKYGAGGWTGHSIGALIVVGVVLTGLIGVPEARYLLAGALPLGALLGFALWRLHEWEPYALRSKRK